MSSTRNNAAQLHESLLHWYAQLRCAGSPEHPGRIWAYARAIWRDFEDVFDRDELDARVWETLRDSFKTFVPPDAEKDDEVEDRFVGYFARSFKHDLFDAIEQLHSVERRKSCRKYASWKSLLPRSIRSHEVYEEWRNLIFRQVLRRLDRQTQKFVQLHCVEHRGLGEVSGEMSLSPRSLSRVYGGDRLAETIQSEIRSMVLALPHPHLDRVVSTMYWGNSLDEEQITSLLALPLDDVLGIIRGLEGRSVESMGEIEALFSSEIRRCA
jgi:hypothetical protein